MDRWIGKHGSPSLRQALDGAQATALRPDRVDRAQALLIEDLLTIDGEDDLLKRLQESWGFDQKLAVDLANIRLERTPGRLSLKAVRKVLPHLISGQNYHDACQNAGYLRHDQQERPGLTTLDDPPRTRNPVVDKALYEVRKVVNGIVRAHGLPDVIRVEMARDLKQSKRDRIEFSKQAKVLERLNQAADEFWAAALGQGAEYRASHDQRRKHRLWREQGERCVYSDKPISAAQLASDATQIDHIIPFSLSLDDSYANTCVCFAQANADKGNHWPHAWLDAQQHQVLLGRVSKMRESGMSRSKRVRFESPAHWPFLSPDTKARLARGEPASLIDDFTSRQLNDTRYICRAVKDYLERLGCSVEVSKGEATAALRARWDLNRILGHNGEKNRDDHRHHAVDACVIACTSRRLLQSISSAAAGGSGSTWKRCADTTVWEGMRSDIERSISAIIVSHAPTRQIADAFHDDTAYGPVRQEGDKWVVRYRKILARGLSSKEIESIRDPIIRSLVQDRIDQQKNDPKDAFLHPLIHRDGKTPIKRVRMEKTFSGKSLWARKYRDRITAFHPLGNNHHVEVIRLTSGKCIGRFVSTLEAARRIRTESKSAIATDDSVGHYICALHKNDLVEVIDGTVARIYRIQSVSEDDTVLRLHTDALGKDRSAPAALRIRKGNFSGFADGTMRRICVDPLGRMIGHDQAHGGNRKPGTSPAGTSPSGGGAS